MAPSVLVFDMGKVLLNFDPLLCIAPYVSDPEAQAILTEVAFASPEWKMLDAGTISEEEALRRWQSRLPVHLRRPMAKVFANWHLHMPELPKMTALVHDLHRAGYPLYLLSNVSVRFDALKGHFPALRLFSGVVTSAPERCCKPDAKIYQILLSRYQLKAEDCLFVDDLPANVEGAKAVGMDGVVFDGDADKLRRALICKGVRLPPYIQPKRAGLVLEGGAQRGVFTAGVLDCLMDAGIRFPYVIGVSAGACNAFSYVSHQPGRTLRCMIPTKDTLYFGPGELLRTGRLMNLEKVFFGIPKIHPFDFDRFFVGDTKLEIVAADLETGRPRYFPLKRCSYRMSRIGMASCSMPIFASPVKIDGRLYLDGGALNSIPVARAFKVGCDKAVVILTRLKGQTPGSSDRAKRFYRLYFKRYPQFAEGFCNRESTYRKQLAMVDRLEREGKVFVIRPTAPTVGRMEKDPAKLTAFYRHGYDTMDRRMDELRQFLGLEQNNP